MQEHTWIIWLVLFIASLALELLSMQLFSVWFALGALAALLSCAFGAPVWLQVPLFLAVLAVSLAATRPLVKRLQQKLQPPAEDEETAREEEAAP